MCTPESILPRKYWFLMSTFNGGFTTWCDKGWCEEWEKKRQRQTFFVAMMMLIKFSFTLLVRWHFSSIHQTQTFFTIKNNIPNWLSTSYIDISWCSHTSNVSKIKLKTSAHKKLWATKSFVKLMFSTSWTTMPTQKALVLLFCCMLIS